MSAPTPPVVELCDAVAVLGGFPVLAGATLRVDAGEIVLLHGPNGAGKTSLLRLCAGLLPLERGEGRIFGLDLAGQQLAIRPRVGLLGHHNGLYRDLTVAQNVRFWGATVGATSGCGGVGWSGCALVVEVAGCAGAVGCVAASAVVAGWTAFVGVASVAGADAAASTGTSSASPRRAPARG